MDALVVWLTAADLPLLFVAAFTTLLATCEAGFHTGRSRARRRALTSSETSAVSTLTTAMLSLLAFTLGLTISFAQTRFETRRDDVVKEANAIGTAWLRAQLAADPAREPLAPVIADYARVRADYAATSDHEQEARLLARTNALQERIWQQTTIIAHAAPTVISAQLITAVNEMFDTALAQLFALESQVPVRLMLMAGSMLSIGALSMLSFGALGYQFGLSGVRQIVLTGLLLLMWSGSVVLIVDFSEPRHGELQANPLPLQWTVQGMKS